MSNLNYNQLYDKLLRHAKILGFTKTTLQGIKCYCYVVASNEALSYMILSAYFYIRLFNTINVEMKEFRNGISR